MQLNEYFEDYKYEHSLFKCLLNYLVFDIVVLASVWKQNKPSVTLHPCITLHHQPSCIRCVQICPSGGRFVSLSRNPHHTSKGPVETLIVFVHSEILCKSFSYIQKHILKPRPYLNTTWTWSSSRSQRRPYFSLELFKSHIYRVIF